MFNAGASNGICTNPPVPHATDNYMHTGDGFFSQSFINCTHSIEKFLALWKGSSPMGGIYILSIFTNNLIQILYRMSICVNCKPYLYLRKYLLVWTSVEQVVFNCTSSSREEIRISELLRDKQSFGSLWFSFYTEC